MINIKAYSYVRFSTPEQAKGNSLERQTRKAREYADAHGLDLDEKLKFQDEGISAHKGRNYTEGRLAAFVEACDAGTVARGSFLLVENLDRLSRRKSIEAVGQLQEILKRGVTVVTLFDGQVFPPNAFDDIHKLLMAVVVMENAYQESEKKSIRLASAWQAKRKRAVEDHQPMTAMAPRWLALRGKRYEVIEERAAVVQDVFRMTIEGEGKGRIAKRLNEARVAPFGRAQGWLPSSIQKLLENEAVVGRYQPHRVETSDTGTKSRVPVGEPIANYFPPVIDEATFLRARVVRQERRIPSGPRGNRLSNLFTGIATCAHCGGAMHFENKGGGYMRLVCSSAKNAASGHAPNSWPYSIVERFGLLAFHAALDLGGIFPNADASNLTAQLKGIEGQTLVAREKATQAKNAADVMLNLMETSDLPEYRERMEQRSRERADAETEAKRLEKTADAIRINMTERVRDKSNTEEALRQWALISAGEDTDAAYGVRLALQQLLKRSVDQMALRREESDGADYGTITVTMRAGTTFHMLLSDQNEDGELRAAAHEFAAEGSDGVAHMVGGERFALPEWWPA